MKTTLYTPEELLREAMEYSGIKEKTRVLQEGQGRPPESDPSTERSNFLPK